MTNRINSYGTKVPVYRAQVISDTHSFYHRNGAVGKQLHILRSTETEELYLDGDSLDNERVIKELLWMGLKLGHFPAEIEELLHVIDFPDIETHMRFWDTVFHKAENGTKVTLLDGNHDPELAEFAGRDIHGVRIARKAYIEEGNQKYLVEHGHRLDPKWLQQRREFYRWGGNILDVCLNGDHFLGKVVPPLKGAFLISNAAKKIGKYHINHFKQSAVQRAKAKGANGIIVGHIHQDCIETIDVDGKKITYINAGDGLTHGSGAAFIVNGGGPAWRIDRFRDFPIQGAYALEGENPHQEQRHKTLEFLNMNWRAVLKNLEQGLPADIEKRGLWQDDEVGGRLEPAA